MVRIVHSLSSWSTQKMNSENRFGSKSHSQAVWLWGLGTRLRPHSKLCNQPLAVDSSSFPGPLKKSLGTRPVSNLGFPFWILSGCQTTFYKIPIKVVRQNLGWVWGYKRGCSWTTNFTVINTCPTTWRCLPKVSVVTLEAVKKWTLNHFWVEFCPTILIRFKQ